MSSACWASPSSGAGRTRPSPSSTLKHWDERTKPGSDADSVVGRAFGALSRIKQAFIFPTNVPPIPELGAVGGFDFRLQDRSGAGREKLLEVRNMALGMAGKNPRMAGVRPNGQEPAPQLMLEVNRLKAQALGIDLADLNDTLQSALGTAYINDFVRQGRVLRVQMQAEPVTRATIAQILRLPVRNKQGGMVPLAEFCTPRWTVALPKLDRYNGMPAMQMVRQPRARAQHGRGDAGHGAGRLPASAGFRLRMVGHIQRGAALRQPGPHAVRLVGDRGVPQPLRAV